MTAITRPIDDYVIFDLETTGLSPESDAIIEISALKVKDGNIIDEFSTLVNPCIKRIDERYFSLMSEIMSECLL